MQPSRRYADASFLTFLLRRYSAIIAVRCLAPDRLIEFTFVAEGRIGAGEFMRLRTLMGQGLEALAALTGQKAGRFRIRRTFFEGYTQLIMQRDLDTLSVQEVAVMVGLVRQVLGPRVVAEATAGGLGPVQDDDQDDSPETLRRLLQALKRKRSARVLIGLRHSGQPLVYNQVSGHLAASRSRQH